MPESPPLCVDLDGTLVCTDTMTKSLLLLLKANPLYIFLLPFWLRRGRAYFKRQLSSRVKIDPATLPYCPAVLDLLRREHEKGRMLILATGTDEIIAQDIARHLGIFDNVLASNGEINLTSHRKLEALQELLGPGEFDYAGNSRKDLAVWRKCRLAYVVNAPSWVISELEQANIPHEVLQTGKPGLWERLLRLIKVHN